MAFESDPDYDDFEFREQHPDIYGDDGVMDDYYGGLRRASQNKSQRSSFGTWTTKDEQFHQEYLAWKSINHKRIEQLNTPSPQPEKEPQSSPSDESFIWVQIVFGLMIYAALVILLIQSCNE